VLGHTAAGKTQLAVQLAHYFGGVLMNADSRQVYKHLDIGTGKDKKDFWVNGSEIEYRLFDIAEPGSRFHLWNYIQSFTNVWNELQLKNRLPIICGGSGLYIEALVKKHIYASVPISEYFRNECESQDTDSLLKRFKAIESSLGLQVDVSTRKRLIRALEIAEFLKQSPLPVFEFPHLKPLYLGISFNGDERRLRIKNRLEHRLKNGLIEEVDGLLQKGYLADELIRLGLEYRFVTEYLLNKTSYVAMKDLLEIAICQYAKRQMTWFRKMERDGAQIQWLPAHLSANEQLLFSLKAFDQTLGA
jgi:tRNA dimethylallyltransferase